MAMFSRLLRWYGTHKRDLPWRKTRNPYRIFVSEIMLQQTQVDRVIGFYRAWMKRFPTWQALADATTPDLLHAWAGLGYNRRALQLRDAARQVMQNGVPQTMEDWKTLKGVGPYTASAIQAIVARERLVVIDTNVRRVAGRFLLGVPYPALTDDARIARAIDRALPVHERAWEFPQMLMDVGTAICTSKNPDCARCPLRTECRAARLFLSGNAGTKPRAVVRERRQDGKSFPDRIYRGRILAAVRSGARHTSRSIGATVDPTFRASRDQEWIERMLLRLERDGMIVVSRGRLHLPTH